MSNFLRSGEGKDLSLTPGQSIAISTISGTVTADVIAGTAKGTNLLSASTSGGTFGPYASGAVIRVTAGEGAIVDYDIGITPVNAFDDNAKLSFDSSGNVAGIADPMGGGVILLNYALSSLVPTSAYGFALRASQGGFGSPLDQSGKLADPAINTALFPPARANNTVYGLGAYRAPAVLNGKLYKITTAGTSAGTEPAGMAAAAIGATVTDGTAVWTVERGPWYTSSTNQRHITAIASGLLPASGAYTCPAIAWDMLAGDSLIVRIRCAWNGAATDSRTALSENTIFGNRHVSTARKGFGIGATGTTYGDFKIFVSDGTTTVNSGHVGAGFTRKPLDGNIRDTLFMIDGLTKRVYAWTDGVAYSQSEMFSGGEKSPHDMDVSTVSLSTLTTNNIILGSSPGNATSYDFGVIAADVIVLPARSLPTNMQAVADFFYSRGAAALLPATLLS